MSEHECKPEFQLFLQMAKHMTSDLSGAEHVVDVDGEIKSDILNMSWDTLEEIADGASHMIATQRTIPTMEWKKQRATIERRRTWRGLCCEAWRLG